MTEKQTTTARYLVADDPRRPGLLELARKAWLTSPTASIEPIVDDYLTRILEAEMRPASWKERITAREAQLVEHLLAGAGTREIAKSLGLTISTVNTYMKRIFAKLEVHSRIELIALVSGKKT